MFNNKTPKEMILAKLNKAKAFNEEASREIAEVSAYINKIPAIPVVFEFPAQGEAATVQVIPPPQVQAITLEMVRARLAEKSSIGGTDSVRALLSKYGASKMSELDPVYYADVFKEVEEIA